MTNLLPAPYKTNCFNYTELGCQSKQDCVDKCQIELSMKQCNNSLPLNIYVDVNNDKDVYKFSKCTYYFNYNVCEEKFKSPDCMNEYFLIKPSILFNKKINSGYFHFFNATKRGMKYNNSLITQVQIVFDGEPDIIYRHSPSQYPVEFICFIGGVISLWTGFSVFSLYAYGKRFLTLGRLWCLV